MNELRPCGQWHSAISCPACVLTEENAALRQRVEELETTLRRYMAYNVGKRAEAAEAKLARVVEALESIAVWSQELQDSVEREGNGIAMWRGCVAEASAGLAAAKGE